MDPATVFRIWINLISDTNPVLGEYETGSESRILRTKMEKIFSWKNVICFFYQKFSYPKAPIKDAQATGEAFSPHKRTSSTSNMRFRNIFRFFWVIFALLDPDPILKNRIRMPTRNNCRSRILHFWFWKAVCLIRLRSGIFKNILILIRTYFLGSDLSLFFLIISNCYSISGKQNVKVIIFCSFFIRYLFSKFKAYLIWTLKFGSSNS